MFEFFYLSGLFMRSLMSGLTCFISAYALYLMSEASTKTEQDKEEFKE